MNYLLTMMHNPRHEQKNSSCTTHGALSMVITHEPSHLPITQNPIITENRWPMTITYKHELGGIYPAMAHRHDSWTLRKILTCDYDSRRDPICNDQDPGTTHGHNWWLWSMIDQVYTFKEDTIWKKATKASISANDISFVQEIQMQNMVSFTSPLTKSVVFIGINAICGRSLMLLRPQNVIIHWVTKFRVQVWGW